MTQRFVVVTNVCRTFFGGLFEAQSAGADCYSIAILQLLFKVWLTVYEYFVSTSAQLAIYYGAVNDSERPTVGGLDVCVIPGGARIVEHHCIVWRSANCANGLGNKTELPLTPTCVGDLEVRHAEVDPNSRRNG